jgi:hypothetical protein
MAGKNLLAPEQSSGRNLLADQGGSLVEQIPGQSEETLRAAANLPPESRIVTKSPFETGLEAIGAVPVLGGVSKLFELGARGTRLAPYGARAADIFIPKTGTELLKTGALTGLGGAAAQTASNLLPPETNPLTRFGVETVAGGGSEGLARSLGVAGRAFRPLVPGGVERAAERVVRAMTPQQVAALPQTVESKTAMVRAAQEKLRGKPMNEPVDAAEVARLLNIESVEGRRRGEQLAGSLVADTERRLAQISQPRTMEAIGADARKLANDRLLQLKADRETATNANKEAMLTEARNKELQGQGVENTRAFKNMEVALGTSVDPATGKTVQGAFYRDPITGRERITGASKAQLDEVRREALGITYDPLTGSTSKAKVGFERLEQLRRRLGDRASGLPETGFDAIGQQDAKDLKGLVERIMSEFTGKKFDKYLKDYEQLSQPINQFQTDVGQALTAPSQAIRGEMATQASTLAKKIFSTPENVDDFINFTGGNRTAVENLARNYISAELREKTPAQINSWLRANREWVSRFPNINKEFADYARKAAQTERTVAKTGKLAEERARMFEMGGTQTQQAESFKNLIMGTGNVRDVASAAKVLGRTPEGAEAFKTGVRDLIGTLPPGAIERSYRDRIKPSMQASGLYTPDEIRFVDDAVADIVSIQTAISRASQNIGRTPGTESSAQELTRLINNELAQVKKGGAVAGLYTAGLAALANRFGVLPEVGGAVGAAGGFGAALALDRYRQYVANVRSAVSDIVTDPVKLKQVMKVPREQRQGVIATLIRQTIGTQVGTRAPERIENAPNER